MYQDSVEKMRGLKSAISSYRTSITSPSSRKSFCQRTSVNKKSRSSHSKHSKRTYDQKYIEDSDSLDEDDINKRKYLHPRNSVMSISELDSDNGDYGVPVISHKKSIKEIIADLPDQLSTKYSNIEPLKNRKLTIVLEENFDKPKHVPKSRPPPHKVMSSSNHHNKYKVRVVDSDEDTSSTEIDSEIEEDMPKIILSDSDDEIIKPSRNNYNSPRHPTTSMEYQLNNTRYPHSVMYHSPHINVCKSKNSLKQPKPMHSYATAATQHISPVKKQIKRVPKELTRVMPIFDEEESDSDLPQSLAQNSTKPEVSRSKPISQNSVPNKHKTVSPAKLEQSAVIKPEESRCNRVTLGNPDYHWWDNEKNKNSQKKLSPSKAIEFEKKYRHRAEIKADEIYEYFANLDACLSDDDESEEPVFVPPRPDERPKIPEEEVQKIEIIEEEDDYEEEKVTSEEEEKVKSEEEEDLKIEPINLKGEAKVHKVNSSQMAEIRNRLKSSKENSVDILAIEDEDSLILPNYDDIDVGEEEEESRGDSNEN